MTAEERRTDIENLIRAAKELEVSAIKERFEVSGVTLRNDLMQLERKGVIRRQYGKIVLREDRMTFGTDFSDDPNIAAKEKIGKAAAALVKDGESIMLYTGTTTLQVARYLNDNLNIIAVTNSIYIAHELRQYKNIKPIMIGGNLNMETGATYGASAIKHLEQYNVDKIFLSVNGIDAEMGITNNQPYETDINLAMIKKPAEVIVVADHTKVGKVDFIRMGTIEDVNVLVTNHDCPAEKAEQIRDKGVEILLV